MLKREQLIGANFSFQHHSFRWTAEQLRGMGFNRMELWGVAPISTSSTTAARG